ncbi:MAG TPA: N-acetylmuramoyl-L-alanine amidase [Steroidobacteraceae bacterium]
MWRARLSNSLAWAFCLSGALGVGNSIAAPTQVAVKDVRVWAGPDATRIVFDLSAPAKYTLRQLQNPERVVVDIAAARLDVDNRELPGAQGFVKQLRAGPPEGGHLRFVVDLSEPATPRSFTVAPLGSYGNRLVVDLEGASPDSGTAPAAKASSANSAAAATPKVVKSAQTTDGRNIVVAIDAGHGGLDTGAIGRRGTYEKNVVLAIALRLKEMIDKEPGMSAVLTRDGDYFIPLRERIIRARKQRADMFVSIHADAFHDRSVAGSSVYVLSPRGATDEAARWLAERENAADLVGGVSLDDKDSVLASVLLDLSQGASMSASNDAAEKVLHELDRVGNVRRPAVQHAGFVVLKSPDIPSMLVETAFITNPGEESKLSDPSHQRNLATAILAGVRAYFSVNPPPGTRFAQMRMQGDLPVVAQSGNADRGSSGSIQ